MKRRTFFQWTFLSWVIHFVYPRWGWADPAAVPAAQTTTDSRVLRSVAGVVLPSALSAEEIDAATQRFITWAREYKAGAEMSAGYGVTQLQVVAPDPSTRYPEQLAALEQSARVRGASFAELDLVGRRALVEAALADAAVDALPRRPDGRHVAADLMSHFYFVSSEGQDWLYNASIRRGTCRGLSSSGARPTPLR